MELARVSLERGADAAAQADGGQTSSHVVAADEPAELASPSPQVEGGANTTAQAEGVRSPLEIASQGEHEQVPPPFFSFTCRSDSSDDQTQGWRCCSVQ